MAESTEIRGGAPEVLEITRTFDAPRGLLFRLWADPAHRMRWWGPEGMGLSELEMDFVEGGNWRMVMRHVSGYDHHVHGTFREIDEPSRLSFTYINDDDQRETVVTMEFVDLGTRTEMRFRQAPFQTEGAREGHNWGWNSTFDLLSAYARTVPTIQPAPVGRPRSDGTAPDMVAARARYELEMVHGFQGKWNPGDPR